MQACTARVRIFNFFGGIYSARGPGPLARPGGYPPEPLAIVHLASGARAHLPERSHPPNIKIVTPGTVGRFIDRLGPLIMQAGVPSRPENIADKSGRIKREQESASRAILSKQSTPPRADLCTNRAAAQRQVARRWGVECMGGLVWAGGERRTMF